ncbi:MAG: exo-alpha-sialidase [Deltaproteobacteria bacterium]|nr:MAG: exo-alpha-sialidase [Deltaproteobacteria bacterium]TMQ22990.1 MAG: exo-alpha-sialidase [Deltaproteobacteria bacterium]
MRSWLLLGLCAACGGGDWLTDTHIIVDGYHADASDCRTAICPHNENTDLTVFDGATYLVHRTAMSQILGPNSSLRISRSDDHGRTWNLLAVLPAIDGRDLRDPCFYQIGGRLALKALTRLPVTSTRDSDVDTIAVGAVSPDGGQTWSPLAPIGPEMWSYWRIRDDAAGVHYSAAYEDGDRSVALFSSVDGTAWSRGAQIYGRAEDTPLETELVFVPSGKLLALVRIDGNDQELLGNVGRLRTKVCWAAPPFSSWDCSRELDGVRLDGPVAFFHGSRLFVVARKHLIEPEGRKRTALYELTGDLDGGDLAIVEHGELPSAGDTSYAGVAPIDRDRVLVTWYSSQIGPDDAWARAIFGASDIWQATIDLSHL